MDRFSAGKASVAHDIDALIDELEKTMGRNDVIISMGAGDVWKVSHTLAKREG